MSSSNHILQKLPEKYENIEKKKNETEEPNLLYVRLFGTKRPNELVNWIPIRTATCHNILHYCL
jgi:hypothetical protein